MDVSKDKETKCTFHPCGSISATKIIKSHCPPRRVGNFLLEYYLWFPAQTASLWAGESWGTEKIWLSPFLYYNKIIEWVVLNNRNLFLTILEVGIQRLRCQQIWFLLSAHLNPFAISSLGGKSEVSLSVHFRRALMPFIKIPLSWSNQCPHAPPPNSITLGIRISASELGENTDIQTIARLYWSSFSYDTAFLG